MLLLLMLHLVLLLLQLLLLFDLLPDIVSFWRNVNIVAVVAAN